MSTKIILGPPGTGKTEYLLRKVEKKLEEGIKPGRIGYFAYTVKGYIFNFHPPTFHVWHLLIKKILIILELYTV